MEYRTVAEGLTLSLVGLGCNNFGVRMDEERSAQVVKAALDHGVTHFDTAAMYADGRSEEILGAALAGARDAVVIATKALPRPRVPEYRPGGLARSIRESCEASLARLRTDRIDVFYQHLPDREGPLEEALDALDVLVQQGKARFVACSNYTAEQMETAHRWTSAHGLAGLVANQVEWSLLRREAEVAVVPTARQLGMTVIPYFPLASGLLTGKYRLGLPLPAGSRLADVPHFAGLATEANLAYVDQLDTFALERGRTILEVAVAWLCAQDVVPSVIAGATSPEQVRDNVAASHWRLAFEDLDRIPTKD